MFLRSLVTMLRKACTDPKLVELPRLDDAIRKLERRVGAGGAGGAGGGGANSRGGFRGGAAGEMERMNGKLILMWLRQVGRSGVEKESANVQVSCKALSFCCASTDFLSKAVPFLAVSLSFKTDRTYAVETEATLLARAKYEAMTVAELRALVKDRNLVDRQQENHTVCVDRFRPVPSGDVPRRQRVPLAELPGDAVAYSVGDTIQAPWSDSVHVLHPARVTKAHKQACCLDYVQPHAARQTVRCVVRCPGLRPWTPASPPVALWLAS
eukprot:SAG22_NODE_662_length_8055_cov_5.450980_4_plen_268_part_00